MQENKIDLETFQLKESALVDTMKNSNHHYDKDNINPYHQEGDVWTHTAMVYHTFLLYSRDEPLKYNHLVGVACILHDIGKPKSRSVDHDKKIVSFRNHDSISALMVPSVMRKFDYTEEEIRRVVKLVSMHGRFFEMFNKDKAEVNTKKFMLEFSKEKDINELKDLVALVRCDTMGRVCTDDKFIFNDKFDKVADVFINGAVDGAVDETNTTKEVVLMVGLPASDKSTIIKNKYKGYHVISRDKTLVEVAGLHGFVHEEYSEIFHFITNNDLQKEVDERLKHELLGVDNFQKVVIVMNLLSTKSRRRKLQYFGKEWKKTCHMVLPGIEKCLARNTIRKGNMLSSSVITGMTTNFKYPLYNEGFSDIIFDLNLDKGSFGTIEEKEVL